MADKEGSLDPRRSQGRTRGRPPSTSSAIGPGLDHLKIESDSNQSEDDAIQKGTGELDVKPDLFKMRREDESLEDKKKRWDAKREDMRRKRLESYDSVESRPKGQVKTGVTGDQLQLCANYTRIQKRGEWALYHYHVDFQPPLERTSDKKAVVRPFGGQGRLGAFIFDGQSLWTATKISADPAEVIHLVGAMKDGTSIAVDVKLVAQLMPGDIMYLQFYSILVRKCLAALKLDLMGRHFFDRTAAISMPNHHLELWPGFITTIRQHEAGLLYCVEITHKVIRLDSVLQVMNEIRQDVKRRRDSTMDMVKEAIAAELVGTIVMTHYNRRTYRVDDISWGETPTSTFPRESGGEISYMDYFRER